jgi:DNA-directed RNA polymerase specialized sigma24 family protein
MDEKLSTAVLPRPRRRSWGLPVTRSPWQRNTAWTPEEAAAELHARRAQLIRQLRGHKEARGVPPGAQEEIVDDATAAVVMSPHGIANQEHLFGAFWIAVAHRCARYREGRPFTRLGSRQRVEFESAVEHVRGPGDPFDTVELTDRMARAADLMAELDPRERQILAVMASYGIGPVPTARHLGLPLGEVRAADRAIKLKLNRVAAIAAEGRMCGFRSSVIAADAAGEANDHDARRAQAHVNACVPCGRVYRKLRREMRGREFQRAAAAAFLPFPAAPLAHVSGLGRLAAWFQQHSPRVLPHGGSERAAEVLGGAGAVKVVAAGALIAAAGTTFAGHIVHTTFDSHARAHHHAGRLSSQASHSYQPVALARAWADPNAADPALATSPRTAGYSTTRSSRRTTARNSAPAPPSKSLGYLALGSSSNESSTSTSAGTRSPAGSARTHAMVASVDRPSSGSASTSSSSSESGSSSGGASPPSGSSTPSGGAAGLGYLGQ